MLYIVDAAFIVTVGRGPRRGGPQQPGGSHFNMIKTPVDAIRRADGRNDGKQGVREKFGF